MKSSNNKKKDMVGFSASRNRTPSHSNGSDKESNGSPASFTTPRSPQTVIPQHMGIPGSLTVDTTPEYKTDFKLLPFDICKAKKHGPVILKKSLLEIRREERKEFERAKNEPQIVCLRTGMVLLKRFIPHPNQVKIIEKCQEFGSGLGGFYKPGYSDGSKMNLQMMCLGMNWDPQSRHYDKIRPFDGAEPPKIPLDFKNLVTEAIQSCRSYLGHNRDSSEVPQMEPDICIVNFYEKSGRLGLHQDKDESEESCRKGLPVVSFSLGDSAEFLYGDDRNVENASKVLLESGDVLIFGGKSRLIYHGVQSICSGTAPMLLMEETSMRPGRLNLTFRKY